MKIAVGTKNPAKIQAVKNVIDKIWPNSEIISIEVNHGTNTQPNTHEDAIQGAIKRAKLALSQTNADYGIGLEGNTYDTKYGMFMDGWTAITNNQNKTEIGSCGSMRIPEKIAQEIRKGNELGPTIDKTYGHENIKHKEGTTGLLTKNLIKRTEGFERGIIFALAPFINKEIYLD